MCSFMKRIVTLFLISLVIFSSFHAISTQNNQSLFIELDDQQTNGMITHYGDINCGPLPNIGVADGVDLTTNYQQIGIDFIRTHDFGGPTDISTIFPDFDADPSDPSSYNFTSSDYHITSIINAGCRVFYRLGESASTNKSLRELPVDFQKWAEICKHVVMHYNTGWAHGFYYNITHWELWNEPDLRGFWNGTASQYFELYKTTVQTLKSYDPTLNIGGPCTSSVYNENFTTRFLQYLVDNQLPLDFYSWHMYTKSPHELFIASSFIRQLLDAYGFSTTENINSEWNFDILAPQRDKDNALNAAFTACCLSSFLDAGLDYSFRYRGTQDHNLFSRFIGFDLALFSYDGLFKTPALTYLAFQYLTKESPIRLSTPIMDAADGITFVAGISEDNTNISIILSNYAGSNQDYTISMNQVPWNSTHQLIHYCIDENNHLEIITKLDQDFPSLQYSHTLNTSSVHFIRLTNASTIPEEGPMVLEIPFFLRLKILDPIRAVLGLIVMIIFFG